MKSSHLRMLLLLGALGLACSPESAFSQEKAAAQAYAGKTVTGEVTVKQTVEDTLQSHRGLKVMQENLDVVRHELRRAKAGWGPSVDAVGRTGASRLSNTTTRPLNADTKAFSSSRFLDPESELLKAVPLYKDAVDDGIIPLPLPAPQYGLYR